MRGGIHAVPCASRISHPVRASAFRLASVLNCVSYGRIQHFATTLNLTLAWCRSDSIDKLISNLHVTDEERRRLVNTRIAPALMPTVLDFLYRDAHADAVPPMLRLTKASTTPSAPVRACSCDQLQISTGCSGLLTVAGQMWMACGFAYPDLLQHASYNWALERVIPASEHARTHAHCCSTCRMSSHPSQ